MPQLFTIAIFLLSLSLACDGATPREVNYSSECSCEGDHGVARWRAKTDPSEPPRNRQEITPITPAEICSWQGPGMIPHGGPRTGNEVRWYALTGRIISVQAESDGDIHLVLVNANDKEPGKVIAEMPLGAKWCALRAIAFSWTDATFPFTADFRHSPFHLIRRPIVTLIGKAFYDTDHSGKELHNNRRPRDKDKAVWEIHPVMALEIVDPGNPIAPQDVAPAEETEAPAAAGPEQERATPTEQFVTITRAVTIKIPYGETVLQPGTKLPLISKDAATARVRYLGEIQSIPLSATDAQ